MRRGCCAHLDNCRGWKVSIKSLQGNSYAAILSSTVSEGCRRENLTAPIDWIAALGRSVDRPSQDEKQKRPEAFASRNASPLLAGNRSGCERGSVSCRAMDSSPAPAPASVERKRRWPLLSTSSSLLFTVLRFQGPRPSPVCGWVRSLPLPASPLHALVVFVRTAACIPGREWAHRVYRNTGAKLTSRCGMEGGLSW